MRIAAFLVLNGLILGAWWGLLSALRRDTISAGLLYAGLMTAAQVVVTQLALAVSGRLDLLPLIVVNVLGAAGCLAWAVRRRRTEVAPRDGARRIAAAIRAAARWENGLLFLLVGFTIVWLVAAAVFLPPRAIDDLAYHLPPIFQAVQNHRLDLLPLPLRDAFAFPFNGELLFLWPLVFFHGNTAIDLGQIVVVLYGMLAVYALARRLEVPPRIAAFAALLFLFIPVVLGQAGTNDIDLIAAVFHLVLLFAALSFYQTGEGLHLAMAGVASGFLLGVRYSMLIPVALAQPILWLRLWRDAEWLRAIRRYALYVLAALPLCAYWPVRNYLQTGNPFYPLQVTWSGLQLVPQSTLTQITHPDIPLLWTDFSSEPWRILTVPIQDPGLGSLYGGFGVVFWGLCAPAIVYCLLRALRAAFGSRRLLPILFWGQVFAAGCAPLLVPSEAANFAPRDIVVVVGLGLVAFASAFDMIVTRLRASGSILRAFAVAASALAVVHLAGYQWPSFQIAHAVEDWNAGRYLSEYAYLPQGADISSLSEVWTPLDFLTRDGPGWNVYMASGHSVFWTASSFGSQLQNRIWNFEMPPTDLPDALIFHRDQRGLPFYYVGSRILPQDVAADGRYDLIAQTPHSKLWVKRELLNQPEMSARLADYYAKSFAPIVDAAQALLPAFFNDGVVITSSRLAYGLRYLALKGKFSLPVHFVPQNAEAAYAERLGADRVYTVDKALPGYQSHAAGMIPGPRGQALIYFNTKS